MRNTVEEITIRNDKIQIIGIDDPAKVNESYAEQAIAKEDITNSIKGLEEGVNLKILLSHRPELFPLYIQYEFEVVFSDHAHGGQVRIPFVGGLVAPNQGLFPEYSSGMHDVHNTSMIVNTGLGNSIIPF
jgi:uncharacterized protein